MDLDTVEWYMKIFHSGEACATTSKELELMFGVRGAALRKIVNDLRRKGAPIASGENGYYYAETEQELRRTIAHMKHRIAGISAAIRGLEHALERFNTTQLCLPLNGGDEA